MTRDEIEQAESYLSEMEDSLRRVGSQIRGISDVMERLESSCRDEPELLDIIRRESGYLNQLKKMADDFSVIRRVRRRLPEIELRLQRQEDSLHREGKAVQKQAIDVRDELEDLLQKFLR